MSEPRTLYPEAWERFAGDLAAADFLQVSGTFPRWEGDVYVQWDDPETGQVLDRIHRIAIELESGFPFQKPVVIPLDRLNAGARHRAPEPSGGALCLYSEQVGGWMPEYTADDLLKRVRKWFQHYHRNDWGSEDRPPDLHLYYHRAQRRHLAITGDDWKTAKEQTGRFGIWEGAKFLLLANTTSSEKMPAREPPVRLAAPLGVRTSAMGVGIWFRLLSEPDPAFDLGAVLADIDSKSGSARGSAQGELRKLIGSRPRREVRTVLALGYPGVDGDEDWLFLDVILPRGRRRSEAWELNLRDIRVRALETAPATASAVLRRTAHSAETFSEKKVLIFGLGAIGSTLALLLAKAGLGSLVAIDDNQLRPGNCIRHAAGIRFSGCRKSEAMGLVIWQHAPDCSVSTHPETWDPVHLFKLVSEADLVIDATANEPFSLLLNEMCVRARSLFLTVTSHRKASVGRFRIVRAKETACLVCYYHHSAREGYPLIPPGDEGEFVEGGCGDPTVEASATDVEFIANIAARAARDLLAGHAMQGTECLIVGSVLQDGLPPLDTVGLHWSTPGPVGTCEVCGDR